MATTFVGSPDPPRRTGKIGKKFVLGYLPCTVLVMAPTWAWVVMKSASGPAAAAGAFLLTVWSIQVCVCNLLILLVRLTSPVRFVAKALLVTVFSVALFPSFLYLKHHVGLLTMGNPDLAERFAHAPRVRR